MRSPLILAGCVSLLLVRSSPAEWLPDASRGRIPDAPVSGRILGKPFQMGKAEIKATRMMALAQPAESAGPPRVPSRINYILTLAPKAAAPQGGGGLRVGSGAGGGLQDGCTIFFTAPSGQKLDGRRFVVDTAGLFGPKNRAKEGPFTYSPLQEVSLNGSDPKTGQLRSETAKKFTLLLEFGKSTGSQVSGRLYLSASDPDKSWASGTFTADIAK